MSCTGRNKQIVSEKYKILGAVSLINIDHKSEAKFGVRVYAKSKSLLIQHGSLLIVDEK